MLPPKKIMKLELLKMELSFFISWLNIFRAFLERCNFCWQIPFKSRKIMWRRCQFFRIFSSQPYQFFSGNLRVPIRALLGPHFLLETWHFGGGWGPLRFWWKISVDLQKNLRDFTTTSLHLSNAKNLVCLGHNIGNEILPSYVGTIINHYKDPY